MSLTRKEQEVYFNLIKGLNNKEIADKMFISVNTIKTHVANILKKHNVKNRVQLMAKHHKMSVS